MLSWFCDDSIDSNTCRSEGKRCPMQSLITGVLELCRWHLMVVLGCHQKSSMIHHSDTPATLQGERPTHTSISGDVQIWIGGQSLASVAMIQNEPWGRILHTCTCTCMYIPQCDMWLSLPPSFPTHLGVDGSAAIAGGPHVEVKRTLRRTAVSSGWRTDQFPVGSIV